MHPLALQARHGAGGLGVIRFNLGFRGSGFLGLRGLRVKFATLGSRRS